MCIYIIECYDNRVSNISVCFFFHAFSKMANIVFQFIFQKVKNYIILPKLRVKIKEYVMNYFLRLV